MTHNEPPSSSMTSLEHRSKPGYCTVKLIANELPEFILRVGDLPNHQVKNTDGELYNSGLLKVLCGSGLASARRALKLEAGLEIRLIAIEGELDHELETGVCIAIAVSIAKQLGRLDAIPKILASDWLDTSESAH